MRTSLLQVLCAGIALALGPSGAALALAPPGTAFTYQGRLLDGGVPVDGVGAADLRFTLWDSAVGGVPVAPSLVFSGVTVSQGLFTLELDFGVDVFDGSDRYLEIEAAAPAGGAFVALSPR